MGGTRGWLDYRDNVEIYNPDTDSWEIGIPLPFPRVFSVAVEINDRIYVMGGYNGDQHFIETVHSFVTSMGDWITVSPTLIGRDAPAAAVLRSGILLIGGRKEAGTGSCPDVEFYSPETDEWQHTTPLPDPRSNLGCGVVEGFPYAVGGTPNPYASIEATNFQGCTLIADFTGDCFVNLYDFSIFAFSWLSLPGDDNWNYVCDISDPKDNLIDIRDLAVLVQHWLEGIIPPTP